MSARMPLTPSFLIATAGAFIGVREQGGNNRGQMVDRFLASVRLAPGLPWCAAFLYHVGYWSHFDHLARHSVWPLPRTASCWELGEFARKVRIMEKEPAAGDVFLLYDAAKGRYAHTGIVVEVLREERRASGTRWYECLTIEGNTNEEGSREGNAVVRKTRVFYPDAGDRFVRWVRLDRREEAGDPREGGAAA